MRSSPSSAHDAHWVVPRMLSRNRPGSRSADIGRYPRTMSAERATGEGGAGTHPQVAFATSPTDDAGVMQRVRAVLYSASFGPDGRLVLRQPADRGDSGLHPAGVVLGPVDVGGFAFTPMTPSASSPARRTPTSTTRAVATTNIGCCIATATRCGSGTTRCCARTADGDLRWHGVLSDITQRKRTPRPSWCCGRPSTPPWPRSASTRWRAPRRPSSRRRRRPPAVELLGLELGGVVELDARAPAVHLPRLPWAAGRGTPAGPRSGPDPSPATRSQRPAGHRLRLGGGDPLRRARCRSSSRRRGAGLTVVIEGRRGPFGVLGVHSVAAREFSAGTSTSSRRSPTSSATSFERQLTDDDIRHRALHDPLTGLPNRVLFLDRLRPGDRAPAPPRDDAHRGPAPRPRPLQARQREPRPRASATSCSRRRRPACARRVRSSDTVARFGGDEFGILLEDITGEQDAIDMAERIAGVFTRPFVLDGNEHFVTRLHRDRPGRGRGTRRGPAPRRRRRHAPRQGARPRALRAVRRGAARPGVCRLRVENDLRRALERDELDPRLPAAGAR